MSRFKPGSGAAAAVLANERAPAANPPPVGSAQLSPPTPSTTLLPQATAPEKLAFGLNMLFLFLVSSRLIEAVPPSLHLMTIVAAIAGVFAVVNGRLWSTMTAPLGIMFLSLTAWFVIGIPLSVWKGGSIAVFNGEWLKSLCIFFLVASVTVNSRQAIWAMRITAYGLLASALLALTTGVVSEARLQLSFRGGGTFANPNYLAAAMCTGVFLWWFIVHDPKQGRLARCIGVGALAAMVVVVIETGSRGALLGLLATIPFLVMQYSLAGRLRIAAAFGALALLVLVVAPGVVFERFTLLFEPDKPPASEMELRVQEAATASTESRLSILERSLEITAQHPLLGVGIGMFAVAESNLAKSEGKPALWHGTHNTYTQVSSETGVPGLILFLSILVMDWRAMRVLRRDRRLSLHPVASEIRTAATALSLILLNTMIYACFAHFAYSSTIPILSGLVFALSGGASRELGQLRAGEKPAPQLSRNDRSRAAII